MNNDALRIILTLYASAWAAEVERYRLCQSHAQNIEQAFWFGMSNAYEDGTDQLLKVLAEPTVPAVFRLVQGLEQHRVQAALYHDELHDQPSLSAYTLGVAEAYGVCAEFLNDVLVEVMLSAKIRVHFRS